MGSICTKPDAIAVAVPSTASSEGGLRSHDAWAGSEECHKGESADIDNQEDHARQSATDVVTRLQSGSQASMEHPREQGGRTSHTLQPPGDEDVRTSRPSRSGLTAGSTSTVPKLPNIMAKGHGVEPDEGSKAHRSSAPNSPSHAATAASNKKERNSRHTPPGTLDVLSLQRGHSESGHERDSGGSSHLQDSVLTTDIDASPNKSSPDAGHMHRAGLASRASQDSSVPSTSQGSHHKVKGQAARTSAAVDVKAADQQTSNHASSRTSKPDGTHVPRHERTSGNRVKPVMSAPVAVELAWPVPDQASHPLAPLAISPKQVQKHPELPPPESVRSSSDMFVMKFKEESEAAAAAAARLHAHEKHGLPPELPGHLEPVPPASHSDHPTSASIRSSRISSHALGQGQPRNSAGGKAPIQGVKRTTHSTAPVDPDAPGLARAPSRSSRSSGSVKGMGAPKGAKPGSARPKQPPPPRPASRQGPPGQLQSQHSISRLSYSTSEPVSGDVLGFPVNRYPVPKPGKQIPVEELAGVGSSWDVRPVCEPSMGGVEPDCSVQSFRPSEIGDQLDMSELNASLPPSNFGTRHGTRRQSHVMDSKDSLRLGLPAGVDPQIAADAMQRLMAEASQTSQASVASSYSYMPASSQAAAMIAMNSSRVNPPQGLSASHRRSLSACAPQQPLNQSTGLRTSGSVTNHYNSSSSCSAGGAPAAPSAGAGASMLNSGLGGLSNSLRAVPSLLMQLPGQQGYGLHAHDEVDEEGQDEPASRGSTALPHDQSTGTLPVEAFPPPPAGSTQPGHEAHHTEHSNTSTPSNSAPAGAQQSGAELQPLQDPFASAAREASQALALAMQGGQSADAPTAARAPDMSTVRDSWQPSDFCIPEEDPGVLEDGQQGSGSSAQGEVCPTTGMATSLLPPVGSFGGLTHTRGGPSHPHARPPAGNSGLHSTHVKSRNASMSLSEAAARRRTSLPMLSGLRLQNSGNGGFSASSSHCGAASMMGASGHMSDDQGMSMRSSAETEDTDARFLSIQSRLAKTASDMNTARRNRFDPYYTGSSDDSEDQRVGTTPEVLERISLLLPPSRLTKESSDSPATSQAGAFPTAPRAPQQLEPHPPPTQAPTTHSTPIPIPASAAGGPALLTAPAHPSPPLSPRKQPAVPSSGPISPRTSITLARTANTVDRTNPATDDMYSGDSFCLQPSSGQLASSPPTQSRLCVSSTPVDAVRPQTPSLVPATPEAMDVAMPDATSGLVAVLSNKDSGLAGANPRPSQQLEPCDVPMMPDQELVAAC